jgi:hypothetical protein
MPDMVTIGDSGLSQPDMIPVFSFNGGFGNSYSLCIPEGTGCGYKGSRDL